MDNLSEQSGPHGREEDVEVATVALRANRRLGLGTHRFQSRFYWHLSHGALQGDGRWLELRRLSFPASSAEAFAEAFGQLLHHLRAGSRP